MTARDDILAALPAIRQRTGSDTFTAQDVIDQLGRVGTSYTDSTIRTHVTSRSVQDGRSPTQTSTRPPPSRWPPKVATARTTATSFFPR